MRLRSDKVSGIITCVFGLAMISFASSGLLMIMLQRMMISTMSPFPVTPNGVSVADMMRAVHGVWFIYFPIMIVSGIVYVVAGFHVHRGSLVARRVAQANAICGYVWVIGYSISCYQIMDIIGPPPSLFPEPANTVFQWVSIVVSTSMIAAFPTGILFVLSRRPPFRSGSRRVVVSSW